MNKNRLLRPMLAVALAAAGAARAQAPPPGAARPDVFGRTPLMLAALKGDTAAVQALLAQGAAVNAKDKYGLTALMWSAPGLVPSLLKSGADVHARDNSGRTALTYAAFREYTASVRALLDRGAEVDAKDNHGATPLFWVIEGPALRFCRSIADFTPDQEIFAEFSMVGAYPKTRPKETAAVDIVTLLLEHGANPNARDTVGRTPLTAVMGRIFFAQKASGRLIAGRLLARGADVNAPDKYGDTPLMAAMCWPDLTMLQTLLAHGADSRAKRRDGQTALSIASKTWWWKHFPKDRGQVTALLEERADPHRL